MCYGYAQWLGSHVIQDSLKSIPGLLSMQAVYFVTLYDGEPQAFQFSSTTISSGTGQIQFHAGVGGRPTVDTRRIMDEVDLHTLEADALDKTSPRALADFMVNLLTTRGPGLSYVTGSQLVCLEALIRIWFALDVSPRISMHAQTRYYQGSQDHVEFARYQHQIDFHPDREGCADSDIPSDIRVPPVLAAASCKQW